MKRLWSTIALLILPMPVFAHHGFEMFDGKQTVTLKGTIKDWQWTNPHTWIQLNVEQDGVVTEWSLEGISISQLGRQGWKRDMLKVGDVVSVSIHPLRNGKPGGQWMQVFDANGKMVGPPPAVGK
jgi:Family of unknown function (DUF6152)